MVQGKTHKSRLPVLTERNRLQDRVPQRFSRSRNTKSGPEPAIAKKAKETPLDRLKSRALQLDGSKFRFLNEALYMAPSANSLKLFQKDPSNFRIYHDGFRTQVKKWPQNPVDDFIACIRRLPSSLVIVDFGCGEAKIAQSVSNRVHSFDLVAVNDHVIACDIAKVPLEQNSVHLAIFCLSLMGTNWPQFIREANRVLKQDGMLKIAEVRSRISSIPAFIEAITSLGFKYVSVDDTNVMFLRFEFTKLKSPPKKLSFDALSVLKPCLYKKR